ncbi:MAG: amidase [Pseudomonadales bacterium]
MLLVLLLAALSARPLPAQTQALAQAEEMSSGDPLALARFDPLEASIAELQVAMGSGRLTARELVDYYLARIARYDPALNSIATLNPTARSRADALDLERAESGPRGPLHGIVLLVKDNFETRGMPTTAGSVLLHGFQPEQDAEVVKRLRSAGAILLGKTNMHEFAYGITTVGSGFGVTRNPYDVTRNPGGSSGGTAAAVTANFAVAGLGTDTCGSIRIPAAHNNLVGLRGTQGLVSRSGIVPLSHTQDIAGPIARSVADLALVLDAIAGFDPKDEQTAASYGNQPKTYQDALRAGDLAGIRIGVLEDLLIVEPADMEVADVFGAAMSEMQSLGATVERIHIDGFEALQSSRVDGFFVLIHEFKTDINAYFASHPNAPVASLDEILLSGQYDPAIGESLRLSQAMDERSDQDYLAELAHRERFRLAVLAAMAKQKLDVLAYPTLRRTAALIDAAQPGSNCRLSANTGLPALSVPAGFTPAGLPVGLELLARPWREEVLLGIGHAYERSTRHRRAPVLGRTAAKAAPVEEAQHE